MGPRGHTPSDGGMLTSDREGWGADGVPGAAEELEKISRGRKKGVRASDPHYQTPRRSFSAPYSVHLHM